MMLQQEISQCLATLPTAYDLTMIAKRALPLLDLTSLNDNDTAEVIRTLCDKAVTPYGHVAAVCIYPQFVALARECLNGTPIRIATVANFPQGTQALPDIMQCVEQALADGADEIDVVIDYRDVSAGHHERSHTIVEACKKACGSNAQLKVILETGELKTLDLIATASANAITAGADFLKTSTGKVPVNATLEAAAVMLLACKSQHGKIGFKAAGGVRTTAQAAPYLALADHILGAEWVTASHFRFGASSLLDDILKILGS